MIRIEAPPFHYPANSAWRDLVGSSSVLPIAAEGPEQLVEVKEFQSKRSSAVKAIRGYTVKKPNLSKFQGQPEFGGRRIADTKASTFQVCNPASRRRNANGCQFPNR